MRIDGLLEKMIKRTILSVRRLHNKSGEMWS